MPKIKKNKIEQCTKIFIYRDLKWVSVNRSLTVQNDCIVEIYNKFQQLVGLCLIPN